jgi:hypothetical protein
MLKEWERFWLVVVTEMNVDGFDIKPNDPWKGDSQNYS